MDFKQFLGVLRRRWATIIAVLALGLGIAAAVTFTSTPKYESRAQLFLSVDVTNTSDAYAALLFQSNRAASYATLAQSTTLAERVVDSLDLDMSPDELADNIKANVITDTALIEIVVKDEDPRQAQLIAKATTREFASYLSALETPSGGDSQITVQVSNEASYDPDAVSPRLILNFVIGGLAGLVLGVALALVRDLLDRTIRTADHVAEITEAPVLVSIGFDNEIRSAPLLTDLGGFAARTEAFRLLRTNLQFIGIDEQPRCLVITSAVPGEGKTMTSTNLAVAMAQTGRNTLIVDADLRRPRVATTLGLDPAIGLTTALVGKTAIHDAIQVHEASGLHVLASGAKPPNPTEILQSRITADLIKRLCASYDMVIIDAPPLLPVADASVLSRIADGTIVVIRHGKTTRDQVNDAINRIQQVGGRVYGVVVNMVAKRAVGSYYYYYYEEPTKKGGGRRRS